MLCSARLLLKAILLLEKFCGIKFLSSMEVTCIRLVTTRTGVKPRSRPGFWKTVHARRATRIDDRRCEGTSSSGSTNEVINDIFLSGCLASIPIAFVDYCHDFGDHPRHHFRSDLSRIEMQGPERGYTPSFVHQTLRDFLPPIIMQNVPVRRERIYYGLNLLHKRCFLS